MICEIVAQYFEVFLLVSLNKHYFAQNESLISKLCRTVTYLSAFISSEITNNMVNDVNHTINGISKISNCLEVALDREKEIPYNQLFIQEFSFIQ